MAETGCGRLDYPSFRRKIPRAAAVLQVAPLIIIIIVIFL
jgi:hypothetical protein